MGVAYQAVQWNRQKRLYDLMLVLGAAVFMAIFIQGHLSLFPGTSIETVLIRAFGAAALTLLHIILIIGPLCRISPRFLPLLYNRRHMGVMMFFMALAHAALVVMQYHAFGNIDPLISIFSSSTTYGNLARFPFQTLGAAALAIFFMMAATSHDFWLANLTPKVWKMLHMSVYLAYVLVLAHVTLGVMQISNSPEPVWIMGLGMAAIIVLHLIAGFKGQVKEPIHGTEFVEVCSLDDIPEKRAKIVTLSGERVAVFKYDGKVSAVSNVCVHQNGPLGEGKIIDGCVTCPWHGFQYRPNDGCSPPPFNDKIPTFKVMLRGKGVFVHPVPNKPGTPVEPALIQGGSDE